MITRAFLSRHDYDALSFSDMMRFFPKLTALQCRFTVSLAASLVVLCIYLFVWNPRFAYAAEMESAPPMTLDELHVDTYSIQDMIQGDEHDTTAYSIHDHDHEQDTNTHHVHDSKRAVGDTVTLAGNNIPGLLNIDAGNTTVWHFSNASLWGPFAKPSLGLPSVIFDGDTGDSGTIFKRQASSVTRTVYISVTTCLQPLWNASMGNQTADPPQLVLYVSNSTANKSPGPSSPASDQVAVNLIQGFANYSMNATTDVYMAVHAPPTQPGFSGIWNYEIAASIDNYYHAAHPDSPFLYLVDTDTHAALLVTNNLTTAEPQSDVYQKWMNLTSPFTVFVQPTADKSLDGMRHSYCGMTHASINNASSSVQSGMITRGLGHKPKEQFYIQNLNSSVSYFGVLAMQGNSTSTGPGVVGGGGQIWQPVNFTTKSDNNCALVFNLTFCHDVAYAVPSNPDRYPDQPSLSAVYDSYAASLYDNFAKSLDQIACNTTLSAQYSPAKNCDDCADAYKQWLCAVTMPRCEDFSSPNPWLQPRNMGQAPIRNSSSSMPYPDSYLQVQDQLDRQYIPMTSAPSDSNAYRQTYASVAASNSSRNPSIIVDLIAPGPYKEVKPCEDLCYSLVRSCPAALGFGCPDPGRGLEVDYGKRSDDGNVTCSYLGAVYYLNAASASFGLGGGRAAILVAVVLSFLLVV
jgi:calcium channel MID1